MDPGSLEDHPDLACLGHRPYRFGLERLEYHYRTCLGSQLDQRNRLDRQNRLDLPCLGRRQRHLDRRCR